MSHVRKYPRPRFRNHYPRLHLRKSRNLCNQGLIFRILDAQMIHPLTNENFKHHHIIVRLVPARVSFFSKPSSNVSRNILKSITLLNLSHKFLNLLIVARFSSESKIPNFLVFCTSALSVLFLY